MKILKLVTFFLLTMALPCLAQTYPSKPVKIIVPFAAGGPADNYARFIALNEPVHTLNTESAPDFFS